MAQTPEPKDFQWLRTANLAQLRAELIKAEEKGDAKLASRIRAQMKNINKDQAGQTILTAGE